MRTFLLSALVLSLVESAGAQTTSPPWLMQSGNFFMVVFKSKADAVQKLLPKGVEALADKDGLVGTALEMYETSRASGIPSYRTAFLVVDVKGHDSSGGTPGHFALWGRVSPPESLNAFVSHFGFPYEDADITLGLEEGTHVGIIADAGKEILKVKVEPVADQPIAVQGRVNMVGRKANGVVRSEVPYLSHGNAGKVVTLEVQPQADAALALIQGATPVWAMVAKDQTFSYSAPTSAGPR
jgi:hypothetical protein